MESENTTNTQQDQDSHPRLVLWFVRGMDEDGKRWESGHRHSHREGAEDEIERWRELGKMGEMKIMREVFPQNAKVK